MRRTEASKKEPDEADGEREYPHWNRVYGTVVVFTILVIILIWAFSRTFE
ncbi:MAG: hypothetical protein SF339_14315 [Blastocatellia bacterium]|nr:hypothetical protein [Blastocatellia bacterium]